MSDPIVSVIIPAFNAEKYIVSAVNSILNQTLTDFEVVIIDDGSTDSTYNLINRIKDSRLRIYSRGNKGLAETLRELVSKAKGTYIARMDADDVSLSNRLKLQVAILETDPGVILVGSNVTYIDESNKEIGRSISLTSKKAIRKGMLKGNLIFHPSVMFRKKDYYRAGGYHPYITKYCEDYLLWIEMLKLGEIHILRESLLKYRVHSDSLSRNSPEGLPELMKKIRDNKGSYPDIIADYDEMLQTPINKKNESSGYGFHIPYFLVGAFTILKNVYFRVLR